MPNQHGLRAQPEKNNMLGQPNYRLRPTKQEKKTSPKQKSNLKQRKVGLVPTPSSSPQREISLFSPSELAL
jgi:hypothetical protein